MSQNYKVQEHAKDAGCICVLLLSVHGPDRLTAFFWKYKNSDFLVALHVADVDWRALHLNVQSVDHSQTFCCFCIRSDQKLGIKYNWEAFQWWSGLMLQHRWHFHLSCKVIALVVFYWDCCCCLCLEWWQVIFEMYIYASKGHANILEDHVEVSQYNCRSAERSNPQIRAQIDLMKCFSSRSPVPTFLQLFHWS